MRKDGANGVALRAFDVKEVALRGLDEFLEFVHVFLCDWVRIQKVHFHFDCDGLANIFNN